METRKVRYTVIYEGRRTGLFKVLDLMTREPATRHGKPLSGLSHSTADTLAEKMNACGRLADPMIGVPKHP